MDPRLTTNVRSHNLNLLIPLHGLSENGLGFYTGNAAKFRERRGVRVPDTATLGTLWRMARLGTTGSAFSLLGLRRALNVER